MSFMLVVSLVFKGMFRVPIIITSTYELLRYIALIYVSLRREGWLLCCATISRHHKLRLCREGFLGSGPKVVVVIVCVLWTLCLGRRHPLSE